MGARLGQVRERAEPRQRACGDHPRGARPQAPARHRLPRLRRRDRVPLRSAGAAQPRGVRDHVRGNALPLRRRPHDLVDPQRLRQLRAPLERDAALPGARGQHARDDARGGRDARLHPRGRARGLRGHDARTGARRVPDAPERARAVARRRPGPRPRAVQDAVARCSHHEARRRAHRVQPRAEPQRAVRPRGHVVDPPDEVRRHLVGPAHQARHVAHGPHARGDDGQREEGDRLRARPRHPRGSHRGVEHGLGPVGKRGRPSTS